MTSTTSDKNKKIIKKIAIVIIWLVVWQLFSMAVNNRILIAGPIETVRTLLSLVVTSEFWLSVLNTFYKITAGFLAGILIGSLLAALSYRFTIVREFFSPFVTTVKSVPVASFVVLLLIWTGAPLLSVWVSALVVFPIVYLNCLEGLLSTDKKLLEMARIFNMSNLNRIRYIYIKTLSPFLRSALSLSAGMAWKSGIAAELIGRPKMSIGSGLYSSKIYIDTGALFAWTFTAVVLAWSFEKAVRMISRRCIK